MTRVGAASSIGRHVAALALLAVAVSAAPATEVAGAPPAASDPGARAVEPDPPLPRAHRRTVEALLLYERLAREDDGEALPAPARPVDAGEPYAGIPRLARLLRRVGDLPATAGDDATTVYAGAVVEAVKSFQRRHGLEPDGRLGPATIRELNVPLGRRAAQLRLTLLRWESLPRDFAPPYVIVNIPEYRLHASDGHDQLSTNVVVGNAYRSRTPVFSSELRQVVFRPWWNVPRRIQRNELAPKIARDPAVLDEERYVVVGADGTAVTSPDDGDELVARLRSGAWRLRQRPGPTNALGLVKFVLPNVHDVYLHASPARRLFSRPRRDLSHGCIRVEDARGLARWVLRDEPSWSLDRIDAAMAGTETIVVRLRRPIPVVIVYGTAVVREDGEVRFFQDVYGYDAQLVDGRGERAQF